MIIVHNSAYPRVVQLRHNSTIAYLVVQQSKLSSDLLWMTLCTLSEFIPVFVGVFFMWHNPFSLNVRALLVENKVSKFSRKYLIFLEIEG